VYSSFPKHFIVKDLGSFFRYKYCRINNANGFWLDRLVDETKTCESKDIVDLTNIPVI